MRARQAVQKVEGYPKKDKRPWEANIETQRQLLMDGGASGSLINSKRPIIDEVGIYVLSGRGNTVDMSCISGLMLRRLHSDQTMCHSSFILFQILKSIVYPSLSLTARPYYEIEAMRSRRAPTDTFTSQNCLDLSNQTPLNYASIL